MKRVLVTGASGFIGQALGGRLLADGLEVSAALRNADRALERGGGYRQVVTGEIGSATDWSEALRQSEVVVHLAARVHVMKDEAAD